MPKEKQIAQKVRSTSRNEVKTKQSKNLDAKVQIIDKKKLVQETDSEQSDDPGQQESKNSNLDKKSKNGNQNIKNPPKALQKLDQGISDQSEDESSQSSKDILYPRGTYLAYVDPSLDDPTQFKICLLSEDVYDIENDEEQYQCSIYESTNQVSQDFNLAYKISFVFAFTIICSVKLEVQKKQNLQNIKISKQELKKIQKLLPAVLQEIQRVSSDEEESEDENKSSLKKPAIKILGAKKFDEIEKSQENQQKLEKAIKKSKNPKKSNLDDEDSEDGKKNKSSQKVKKIATKKFKLNKCNPDVEIEQFEAQKMSRSEDISTDCCITCTNREVHRAVLIKDYKLLKKCIQATYVISSVDERWGPDCRQTPFTIALEMGDHKALECILKPNQSQIGFGVDIYNNRVKKGGYLMTYVDSGKIEGNMAYGSYIRTVQMSRGNKQGNNAFLQQEQSEYLTNDPMDSFMAYGNQNRIFSNRKLSPELFIVIQKLTANRYNNFVQQLQNKANDLVLAGDYILIRHLIKDLWQQTNYGYNQLHYNVLCDLEPEGKLPEFKSVNCQKKCQSMYSITPLHLACINPNSEVLKQILQVNGDFNMTDQFSRKPIHFASMCESVECLKVLLEKGANLLDVDNQKNTTLYFAVQANRPDNVTFIISQVPSILNLKNRTGNSPMQIACEEGYFECIKILLQSGVKINSGLGRNKMPPLLYAAQNGDYEMAEWLLDNNAKVQSKDKFKRTALIMACRNGHIKLVSLLLQRGADWQQTDSSGNSPLHFAAAFGWPDIIKLLLKTGAKINIENSWRTTPINIAMLKNHEGCVKTFLEYPDVDVNCKDEKGRTLLSLSLININERTQAFVQYLLEKNADTNIADIDGKTPLHYLADINAKQVAERIYQNHYGMGHLERKNIISEQTNQIKNYQLNLADLLVANGASLKAVDNQKQTPFSICLDKDNVELLKKLLIGVTLDSNPSLLHNFTKRILDIRYQEILKELLKNTQPSVETINTIDDQGLTPFLAYLNHFSDNFQQLKALLIQLCNFKAMEFKDNFQQYQLKNSDLFDQEMQQEIILKTQNQNNKFGGYGQAVSNSLQVVQDFVSHQQILKFSQQLVQDLVTKPFIDILTEIINQGANPFQQVQKLKKFRLQEIENNQIIEENQIKERVKKREEVLQEREKKNKKTKRTRNQTQELELRPGEGTGNSEYHTIFGLRNAFHFVINSPQPLLIDFLEKLAIDPDIQDHRGITPFNALTVKYIDDQDDLKDKTIQKFISYGVRIDFPDSKGRTPFLNLYSLNNKKDIARAEQLLQLGANVNQIDASGLFALKYALIRRDREQIEKMIKNWNANVNQIDSKGRNLLHHAVNMSSATADATFEIEQLLIDFGIDINLQDSRQRTPLHYAFVKIQNWKEKSQIDPIETVSGLCVTKGLKPDLPDKWLKTPLHYASNRGASICSLYLQKSGANIEAIDIYGNTPLGVALQSKHFNYCILMIQKQADINKLVYKEDPELLEAQWKKEKQDVEMEDQKAHRNLFDQQTKNVFYGSEQDSEDESSDNQFEQTMFNRQNAFRQNVFAKKAVAKNQAPPPIEVKPVEEDWPMSMFRISIKNTQLGLAYLILDQQFSLMLAMQDALDEKKFQLVLTLLQKVQDDRILKQKNEKGQNLFHVLCQNAKHCAHDHMMRIYQQLKKRGVSCLELDNQNRSALHYAVNGGTYNLVEILLSEGLSARQQDKQGLTPLATYLKGDKCLTMKLYNSSTASFDSIFKKLIDAGSVIDQEYQEDFYKTEQKYSCTILINVVRNLANINDLQEFKEKVIPNVFGLLKVGAQLNIADTHGRDCMIYAVMANNNYLVDLLLQNAQFRPSDLRRQDYLRKSVVHYIVQPMPIASYENVQLLDKIHQAGYELNLQDNDGLTPLDYALQQSSGKMAKKLISFLNIRLNDIPRRKFSGISENEWDFSNIDYKKDSELLIKEAQQREDQEMKDLNKIKELVPVDSTGKFQKSYSVYVEQDLIDPQTGDNLPPKPWDAYLTKVDLKNGLYGDYVFYKIQLLYDSVRDLYVVFTRWGRIGDDGMNQRTPFPKLEEAKADFCLTFKAKTGNDFSVPNVGKNFQRVKKKYDLARITYSTVNHQDYMAPFDFDNCPKAKGIDSSILELIEEIANITMFQKAVKQLGLDTKTMPIANLSKETINQATFILGQIKEVLEKDREITQKGLLADHEELQKVKDQISDLSSRYYELIPLAKYHNQIAPPLTQLDHVKQHFEALQSLSNIEMASKMLLGAIYRQKQINPIQYVYEVLNLKIDLLQNDTSEYEILMKYIKSTNEGSINFTTHKVKIFKIQRKGEAERIDKMNLQNHKLLYHGSQLFNFIGILADGLRIAPPEAPATGYMFGKGVYFADMLQKSYQYSQQRLGFFGGLGNYERAQDSTLLLMCEVALGSEKKVWRPTENGEPVKLENTKHSVHGVGKHGPDYSQSLFLKNGIEIPQGKIIEYKDYEPESEQKQDNIQNQFGFQVPRFGAFGNNQGFNQQQQPRVYLAHNEYIVYSSDQVRMRYLIQILKKTKEEMNN